MPFAVLGFISCCYLLRSENSVRNRKIKLDQLKSVVCRKESRTGRRCQNIQNILIERCGVRPKCLVWNTGTMSAEHTEVIVVCAAQSWTRDSSNSRERGWWVVRGSLWKGTLKHRHPCPYYCCYHHLCCQTKARAGLAPRHNVCLHLLGSQTCRALQPPPTVLILDQQVSCTVHEQRETLPTKLPWALDLVWRGCNQWDLL